MNKYNESIAIRIIELQDGRRFWFGPPWRDEGIGWFVINRLKSNLPTCRPLYVDEDFSQYKNIETVVEEYYEQPKGSRKHLIKRQLPPGATV